MASPPTGDPSHERPPAEAIVELTTRRTVLLLFTAAFIIGLPFWWMTTTIERLTLPSNRVQAWSESRPCVLRTNLGLNIRADDGTAETLVPTISSGLLAELAQLPGARCLDITSASDATTPSYEIVLSTKAASPAFLGRSAVIPATGDITALRRACIAAAKTLLDLDTIESEARVVKFAPRYKIAISLLNEDSTQEGSLVEWDAQGLVARYIQPLLSSLSDAHEFDVDTSIQYFAPLAIPVARDTDTGGTIVQESDLRAFVNNAEWNMPTSNTLDPVLHFMLYVPSAQNRPMRINTNTESSPASFILPQRGGVILVNPTAEDEDSSVALRQTFLQCRRQLSRILGVPWSPSSSTRARPDLWQIDAVHRKRLYEASKDSVESLDAIIKLVAQLPNMRVGSEVKARVIAALDELDSAQIALSTSVPSALAHASRSAVLASKAYFDPSMLALLYFPDEHKYAIYTPLFGPVMVPILMGLLREWKAWKAKKKTENKHEKKE